MESKPPFRRPTGIEFAEAARLASIDRYARQQSQSESATALDKLHELLVDDASLYLSDDLQDQRDAVAQALLAVTEFLREQGFSFETLVPLMRPIAALTERESNSIDKMFVERKRPGRPNATLTQHERTGILAAFANFWLGTHQNDGRSQTEKLAEAARKMRGRWFGQVSRAQLKTARDFVSQEARDHPAVAHADIFNTHMVRAAEIYGADGAFAITVQFLNDNRAGMGLGEGGISKTPHVSPTTEA